MAAGRKTTKEKEQNNLMLNPLLHGSTAAEMIITPESEKRTLININEQIEKSTELIETLKALQKRAQIETKINNVGAAQQLNYVIDEIITTLASHDTIAAMHKGLQVSLAKGDFKAYNALVTAAAILIDKVEKLLGPDQTNGEQKKKKVLLNFGGASGKSSMTVGVQQDGDDLMVGVNINE